MSSESHSSLIPVPRIVCIRTSRPMRAGRAQLLVTAQVLADEHDRRRRTSCSIARDEPAREPLAVGRRFKLDTTKNCVVETIAVGAGSASITVRAGAVWAPTIT